MHVYVRDTYGFLNLSSCTTSDLQINLDPSPSMIDDTAWDLIQSWLDTCIRTHKRCNEREQVVPDRLLQLDRASESFRLINKRELEPSVRYVTLTHCYNIDNQSLQLTQSTLEQLSSSQPLSTLPLAYRDAFSVISRLGLSYLWIDRLCVFQTDRTEPSRATDNNQLRDIFSNAFLGIATTGSTSPSSGLFATHHRRLITPTVLHIPVDDKGTMVPYMAKSEQQGEKVIDFWDEPLSKSAQAMNQRLLTPRMLHFGRSLIYWECHSAICDETHPKGRLNFPDFYFGLEGEKTQTGQELQTIWKPLLDVVFPAADPVDQVFVHWFALLERFALCSFSSPGERLARVAGLASEMGESLSQRGYNNTAYFAGMWKAMLPGGLLWNIRKDGHRPAGNNVPSWSWAAVEGPLVIQKVTPERANEGLICELVSANMSTPSFEQVTGISDGVVVLKGKLFSGKAAQNTTLPPSIGTIAETRWDLKSLATVGGSPIAFDAPNSMQGLNWTVVFDTKQDVTCDIFCFPIYMNLEKEQWHRIAGLVLSQLDDGRFARRGLWSIVVDSTEKALEIIDSVPNQDIEIV
uniref:Heterokaryon incompatibility domain-containing protein n=1 Tax=Bionectria ochroleuca TaxID=29856 RepID=A0A8H7N0N2_BIOOC